MAEIETTVEEETTTEQYSELTEADYYALQERLKKAEESLVKYKKQAKTAPVVDGEIITKTDLSINRFIDKNPEYEGKEEELKSYIAKGLTIEQAKKIVEPNEEVVNRKKTKESVITAWEQWGEKTSYTKKELEEMNQSEYNKVMDLRSKWKVVIKG